ncbi:conserved hypothetical protein [Leishmania infantum JPCM5]|uniref:WD_domain_-_G-beta_repeat_-_putative n=2 Tax=Leishmania infantum TaxID=5671 RepID=A0A6L0XIW1_LEIIN|nr:conserved hypothetical protein [Leishmania infantum JPCM5]CAC9498973.1 WD_domain_-_G-beta_repeat_-_putative [Leishmania infantum]CBZ08805.1 conserved hypothetical protein [Leishmania infantum JPCM5]SUZ42939.1 WD_domain_-_G-beta_repeat_-_putative [Leishmania infantum]|eukprot:XP_003392629.1 conserved hypothetical protein [Leishmania infantum JPCM5]
MASPSSVPSSSRVIPHERVLQCVYEFLDENGYQQALRALQAESKVPYNVIRVKSDGAGGSAGAAQASLSGKRNSAKGFAAASERNLEEAVMEGSWAEVLHVYVDGLLLPEEIKATLYEVILEEMVELHGLAPAARSLLLNAPVFQLMKADTPARYIRLEKMVEHGQRTMSECTLSNAATRHVTPEMLHRRTALLQQLKTAIRFTSEAPIGRLAAALARAAAADFGGADSRERKADSSSAVPLPNGGPRLSAEVTSVAARSRKRDREPTLPGDAAWADTFLQYPLAAPKEIRRRLPYAGDRAACCCAPLLSASEELLIVGCANGAVEFVSVKAGESIGNPLRHSDGVLCMTRDTTDRAAPSPDWLAVGYRDGWVKVYNIDSRKLVRRFEKAHTMGITAVFFSGPRNAASLFGHRSFIVTGSFDGGVKVLDIATGAVVQTVANCHASAFVHALVPLECRGTVVDTLRYCFLSSGNDGTVSVWRLEDRREEGAEVASRVEVLRVQGAVPLGRIHHELRDAVPSQLYTLPYVEDAAHGATATSDSTSIPATTTQDALVLTRAGKACVVRVTVTDDGNRYFCASLQALCIIATAQPLRSAFPHVHTVVSMSVPLLTLYAADCEGTVSLHNIEMKWYNDEQWSEFGGCMRVSSAADQSAVVIVEAGKSLKDLQLTCIWSSTQHQPSSVVAYSASLPAIYDMH